MTIPNHLFALIFFLVRTISNEYFNFMIFEAIVMKKYQEKKAKKIVRYQSRLWSRCVAWYTCFEFDAGFVTAGVLMQSLGDSFFPLGVSTADSLRATDSTSDVMLAFTRHGSLACFFSLVMFAYIC